MGFVDECGSRLLASLKQCVSCYGCCCCCCCVGCSEVGAGPLCVHCAAAATVAVAVVAAAAVAVVEGALFTVLPLLGEGCFLCSGHRGVKKRENNPSSPALTDPSLYLRKHGSETSARDAPSWSRGLRRWVDVATTSRLTRSVMRLSTCQRVFAQGRKAWRIFVSCRE